MNLKKILTYSFISASLLTGAAYAGGPDVLAPTACPVCLPGFVPFTYIGVSAGWAFSDWNSFLLSGAGGDVDTSGFSFGGKIGYQFTDHFGIEGGVYDLPESDQNFRFTDNTVVPPIDVSTHGEVNSWFAYGAATIRAAIPFNPFLHVIGKVGGVYRELDHSGDLYNHVGDGSYATVIFGATLEYDLALYHLPLAVGVDYLFVPGSDDSFFTNNSEHNFINEDAAPAAHVVVATVSAHLAI